MKPYKPSNTVPMIGIAWLVLAIFCGILIGGFVFLVSHVIYLILIFPVAMGIAGGIILSRAVKAGKVRNPMLAGLSGVLVGIAIYGGVHYFDYLSFRNAMEAVMSQKVSDPALVKQVIDAVLVKETNLPGFWGYLAITAREGVTISKVFGRGSLNLGQPLTIIYWLIELGIIATISCFSGWERARQPFSEKRNEWYPSARFVGSINDSKVNEFLHLIQIGDFARMGNITEEDVPLPNISIYLQSFDLSQEESILSASTVFVKGSKQIVEGVLSPSQASALMRSIATHRMEISPLAKEGELVNTDRGDAEQSNEVRKHLERAYACQERNDFENAMRECLAVIRLDSKCAEAHNLHAIVLEELGQKEEALAAYREALRLDSTFQEAQENLVELEGELGVSETGYVHSDSGSNHQATLNPRTLRRMPAAARARSLASRWLKRTLLIFLACRSERGEVGVK